MKGGTDSLPCRSPGTRTSAAENTRCCPLVPCRNRVDRAVRTSLEPRPRGSQTSRTYQGKYISAHQASRNGYWTSIVSTVTIPSFIVPVILATTTSPLLYAFGSAAQSARFFNSSAAFALPFSSKL